MHFGRKEAEARSLAVVAVASNLAWLAGSAVVLVGPRWSRTRVLPDPWVAPGGPGVRLRTAPTGDRRPDRSPPDARPPSDCGGGRPASTSDMVPEREGARDWCIPK